MVAQEVIGGTFRLEQSTVGYPLMPPVGTGTKSAELAVKANRSASDSLEPPVTWACVKEPSTRPLESAAPERSMIFIGAFYIEKALAPLRFH